MASITEKGSYVNIVLDKSKWFYSINVEQVILDDNVTYLHCGKNLKRGKTVTISDDYIDPTIYKDGWGNYRNVFCSSSHAKIFAKNRKGL
jgi:predicted transcriptional regulator